MAIGPVRERDAYVIPEVLAYHGHAPTLAAFANETTARAKVKQLSRVVSRTGPQARMVEPNA